LVLNLLLDLLALLRGRGTFDRLDCRTNAAAAGADAEVVDLSWVFTSMPTMATTTRMPMSPNIAQYSIKKQNVTIHEIFIFVRQTI
jgi:hypothetical protein